MASVMRLAIPAPLFLATPVTIATLLSNLSFFIEQNLNRSLNVYSLFQPAFIMMLIHRMAPDNSKK